MNNLKTIGAFLKDARVAKSLTEKQVSEDTKINLKLLVHLENDRLLKLPNKIYVVGFVKSYAKCLGLNEDEALMSLNYTYEQIIEPDTLKKETTAKPVEATNDLEDSAVAVIKTFYNKKAVIAIVASIVLILVIKSAISFFSSIAKEKVSFEKSEIIKPIDSLESNSKVTADAMTDTTDDSKEAVVEEPEVIEQIDEVAVEDKVEDIKEDIADVNEENLNGKFPFVNFYQMPKNLFTVKPDAKENDDEDILPEQIKNKVNPDLQNVYIRAVGGDTWISFKVDDQKIKRYILKDGKGALLQGEQVLLFMGNINATKIFLNNQLIEAPSRTGVKSLAFPMSIASELELPLFPTHKFRSYTAKEYKENMIQR